MDKEFMFLAPFLTKEKRIGLIGAGAFGSQIKELALAKGIPPENILLYDPARSREEAEEINDALHDEWGNGMGGCNFSSDREKETFLPLSSLARADLISIQIPLTEENRSFIGRDFLESLSPKTQILSFSPKEIFSEEAGKDPRILFYPGR